jgi:hypothetical protein
MLKLKKLCRNYTYRTCLLPEEKVVGLHVIGMGYHSSNVSNNNKLILKKYKEEVALGMNINYRYYMYKVKIIKL